MSKAIALTNQVAFDNEPMISISLLENFSVTLTFASVNLKIKPSVGSICVRLRSNSFSASGAIVLNISTAVA